MKRTLACLMICIALSAVSSTSKLAAAEPSAPTSPKSPLLTAKHELSLNLEDEPIVGYDPEEEKPKIHVSNASCCPALLRYTLRNKQDEYILAAKNNVEFPNTLERFTASFYDHRTKKYSPEKLYIIAAYDGRVYINRTCTPKPVAVLTTEPKP